MRFHAIREAMQFELEAFYFYKRAREKATEPEQRLILEHLYEEQLDHLSELEEKYHVHLDREMVELASDWERLLSDWPFRDIQLDENATVADLYRAALQAEQRAFDHFQRLASEFPTGLENELCREVAAEEDEHVAMLQTELEQIA